MINLKLLDNYRLKSDTHNFIIIKEEGNREIPQGFYSSIEDALQGFLSLKIKSFNSSSMFGLVEAIKGLRTDLFRLLQPLKLKIVGGRK